MVNIEYETATRHTRKPSYTDKPLHFRCQSRDKSGKISENGRKVSSPETHGNQAAKSGIFSTKSNASQLNWMNSNKLKLSDAYNQVNGDRTPRPPVDSDVLNRSTIVETPSQIPTPTLRRAKNLSKSSPEAATRPARQMNGRLSQDFRFPLMDDCENEESMISGDGSPSPATRTASNRSRSTRRAHSHSTGAQMIGRTTQSIEPAISKSQPDQRRKQASIASKKPIFNRNSTRLKQTEPKGPPSKSVQGNSPRVAAQKKSSVIAPVSYSKAEKKNEIFGNFLSREIPYNSRDAANMVESAPQELKNPWISPMLDMKNLESIPYASIQEELNDVQVQNPQNQEWEDSIEFTTENLTTSPKLTACCKKTEIGSNFGTDNGSKDQPEYFRCSSSEETRIKREYLDTRASQSVPSSPKNLSSRPESKQREIFSLRGSAKLGEIRNSSHHQKAQGNFYSNDISENPRNIGKNSRDEQTNRESGCNSTPPRLDTDNLPGTKQKKHSLVSTDTQNFPDSLQKSPEKFSPDSKTERDRKNKTIIYPFDSSPSKNSEKKPELTESEKFSFETRPDVDPEDRIAAEAKLFEPQAVDPKTEVNSVSEMPTIQRLSTKELENNEMRNLNSESFSVETPKVVGAFYGTPLLFPNLGKHTSKIRQRRASSLESQEIKRGVNYDTNIASYNSQSSLLQIEIQKGATRSSTIPNIINTARRVTASEDLRLIKKEENIQDSDLESLIEEVTNTKENKEISEMIRELSRGRLPNAQLDWDRLSQAENERNSMHLTMERMKQKLDNASRNFHDLKRGLERLERQVASTSPLEKTTTTAGGMNEHNVTPKFYSWLYIRVPTPRPEERQRTMLFRNRNWKFTWLGLTLLIFSLWFLAETAMCDVFCHPKYSNKNTWQPSDPFFPWAIPTKLDQWTGRIISKRIETILDWFHSSIFPTNIQQWPTHSYSGYDWWEGRSGPAASEYTPSTSYFGAANTDNDIVTGFGNINDDEILK